MPRALWNDVAEYPALRAHLGVIGAEEVVKCSPTGRYELLRYGTASSTVLLGRSLDQDRVTPYVNHPIVLCPRAPACRPIPRPRRRESETVAFLSRTCWQSICFSHSPSVH